MTLPKNETGIVTVTNKRYSVFRIFLLTSCLDGLRRSFARVSYQFALTLSMTCSFMTCSVIICKSLLESEAKSSLLTNGDQNLTEGL